MKIQINESDVFRYLGYKNAENSDKTKEDINFCTSLIEKSMLPQTFYKLFEIEKEDVIKIKNTTLSFEGESIKKLLHDCDRCILMIATLGGGVDELLRKLQITNMAHAVIADFCASSLVEDLINKFEEQIKRDILKDGEFFTDRFSPGYGDLPLTCQKVFCDVLDASKKVGVMVNSAGIMIPRKTVTAVVGIADKPQKMRIKGCKYCDFFKDCNMRKEGSCCD